MMSYLRETSISCLQGNMKSRLALDTTWFSNCRVSSPIPSINLLLILQVFQCFFLTDADDLTGAKEQKLMKFSSWGWPMESS